MGLLRNKIRTLHGACLFHVDIPGMSQKGFITCSPIQTKPPSDAGPTCGCVTLTAWVTDNTELYEWALDAAKDDVEVGRDVVLAQSDNSGKVIRRWTLYGAYPTMHQYGPWDASSSESLMETITITYDRHELVNVSA